MTKMYQMSNSLVHSEPERDIFRDRKPNLPATARKKYTVLQGPVSVALNNISIVSDGAYLQPGT